MLKELRSAIACLLLRDSCMMMLRLVKNSSCVKSLLFHSLSSAIASFMSRSFLHGEDYNLMVIYLSSPLLVFLFIPGFNTDDSH